MEDTWIKWKGGECWEEGKIKVGRWLLDVYTWWNSWERVPKLVEWPSLVGGTARLCPDRSK